MSSLIRELDPGPVMPTRPYTPPPSTPPVPSDPTPLKGDALKRRQRACIALHAFVRTGNGEPFWNAVEINAMCLVANPPTYEGPSRIL